MRLLSARTFRIEAAVIAATSLAVVALALLLVQDAVTRTEGTLRSAAEQELTAAANELKSQYEERSAFSERPLEELPVEAQDLSLRGLARTVLRSYGDVQGGFYDSLTETVIGAAGPRDAIVHNELQTIHKAVGIAKESGRDAIAVVEAGGDLLVSSAIPMTDGRYAWALRRLSGVRDPAPNRRRWLLATIVVAALVGVAGIVSIFARLRRGVEGIKQTLQRLETDFEYRPASGPDDFGEIRAAIAKMADRRMELESSLRRQDRLAALGKVVAGVAHEVRNPLNSIRLQLELLKRRMQKGIASATEVQSAMEQVDRLDLIVSQLLAFGKPGFARRRVQEVTPLARRSVDMVQDRARSKNVGVRVIANGSAQADVDGVQIEQVVTNLLLNAIEASPENGEVVVRVGESDGSVEVQVSDQGAGIPDNVRDHIFDAFFTTRAEGTGLGLSVSREIVAAHGGALDFASRPGETTFFVRLPAPTDVPEPRRSS